MRGREGGKSAGWEVRSRQVTQRGSESQCMRECRGKGAERKRTVVTNQPNTNQQNDSHNPPHCTHALSVSPASPLERDEPLQRTPILSL